MNSIISPQKAIENIIVLCSAPTGNDLDELLLKKIYQDWLKKIQPHCPIISDNTEAIVVDNKSTDFTDYFIKEDRVTFDQIITESLMYPDVNVRIQHVKSAIHTLHENEPIKGSLFDLIINSVLFDQGISLGGTSVNPNYIGVICIHNDMYAETAAIPELLLHELAHNMLFLDELRYQHYKDYALLKLRANMIDSPYLDKTIKLPLDRVLHRMVVFIEILEYRNKHIGHMTRRSQHSSTDIILQTTKKYIHDIESLNLHNKLLTTRGYEIYKKCCNYFSNQL